MFVLVVVLMFEFLQEPVVGEARNNWDDVYAGSALLPPVVEGNMTVDDALRMRPCLAMCKVVIPKVAVVNDWKCKLEMYGFNISRLFLPILICRSMRRKRGSCRKQWAN